MNNSLRALANAKINLHLQVLNRRLDGYHNIVTLFQSVSLADEVEVKLTDGEISTRTEGAVIQGENLCNAAARLFFKKTGIAAGADIFIKKNIPLSAGLAGGSADAAAVLSLLNRAFNDPLAKKQLSSLSAELGADIPFCLTGGTCIAEGIGEKITSLSPIPKHRVVLIKNFEKASTGEMYGRLARGSDGESEQSPVIKAFAKSGASALPPRAVNDFLSVSRDCEEQQKIIDLLIDMGAASAGLSGSGPTVYGLFKGDADLNLSELRRYYAEVYLCDTADTGIKIIE